MTIAIFLFRLISKKASLRERAVMAESINTTRMGDFSRLVRKIITGTIIFEGGGAVLLSLHFMRQPGFGFFKGVYYGFFHAISAFCNAGFDLMGISGEYSSFTSLSGNAFVNIVLMVLIVVGGIGFLVWDDITVCRASFKRFSLHTKIVLCVTAILIFGGAALLYAFERNNLGSDMTVGEEVLAAFFGSVTARTAGFNSVDTAALTPASKLITIILMFIIDVNSKPFKLAFVLLIWIVLMSLIKLKKSDYYHDRKNKEWIIKVISLVLFIIAGLLASINLYNVDFQVLVLGFFFLIHGILELFEPLTIYVK